uniref:Uncharacterized protein n=1 Tax=Tanacetum cinerariifolium TaxID=118510 RepID=A0A699SEM3_TANCI|nr:hypothetical protein [Tanacetum cinerariifolium]
MGIRGFIAGLGIEMETYHYLGTWKMVVVYCCMMRGCPYISGRKSLPRVAADWVNGKDKTTWDNIAVLGGKGDNILVLEWKGIMA